MNSKNLIDPQVQALLEAAATGEAAKMFLNSELGKIIARRAIDEIDTAIYDLIETSPEDSRRISELQMRIKVPSRAIAWLTEAITEGENAMCRLEDEQ